jgi:hypothetical protein
VAALQRRVRALESSAGGGVWKTGDLLTSIRVHTDMLTTTLSDGGRPGWFLLNGATKSDMQTTDPKLFEILGGNVLKDARGKVIAGPDGVTYVAGATVGANDQSVPAAPAHAHAIGASAGLIGTPGVTVLSFDRDAPDADAVTSVNLGTLDVTGFTDSGGGGGGGLVSVIQPTLVVGTVWIKR